MTTTTTAGDRITITMSERTPVKISLIEWPIVARADRHDGKVECEANHLWTIRVREHRDGRRIVYGWMRAGNGGVPIGWRGSDGGYLVAPVAGRPDDEETVRSIRRVGGIIGDDGMAAECIAELPAETL